MSRPWIAHQQRRYIENADFLRKRLQDEKSDSSLESCLRLLSSSIDFAFDRPESSQLEMAILSLAQAVYYYAQPRGEWDAIVSIWPQVIEISEKLGDHELRAEFRVHLATLYNLQGRTELAEALYQSIISSPEFGALSDSQRANVLFQSGVHYVHRGEFDHAAYSLKLCLKVPQSSTNHAGLVISDDASRRKKPSVWSLHAYALNQLGNWARANGRSGEAIQYYQESLAIFEQNGEADGLACISYQSIGRLYFEDGRYEAAIPILERGLAIRRGWGELEGIGTNSVYLAMAYTSSNQLQQAETLLNDAMRIFLELNYTRGKALCYLGFGHLEEYRGHVGAAVEQWKLGLATFENASESLLKQTLRSRLKMCMGECVSGKLSE